MILNIRIFFLMVLICGLTYAQEDAIPSNQYAEDPETVFFNIELFYPVAISHSSYGDYRMDPGYSVDFNWFIHPEFTIGARLAVNRGYPEDISKTGNIERSTFHLLGLDAGYYQALNRDWNLHYKGGIGLLTTVHTAPEDKFTEDGGKLWLSAEISKRLDKTLGIFLKTGMDYDFNHIETSANKNSYFNNNFLLNLGLGIRINFQNPGG